MARGRAHPGTNEQAVIALVRRLGAALQELGLGEIEVAWGDVRVRVQRPAPPAPAAPMPVPGAPVEPAPSPVVADVVPASRVTVEAPMVGTFYRAPSPNAEPYVREGDVVKEGQIVCIIEAMKLMNEIEAKVGGRIAKILVESGHAVEYGQPLFLIEPAG
jgi:acetyl-CoA carboxylase biotin carboxyl carrier protein